MKKLILAMIAATTIMSSALATSQQAPSTKPAVEEVKADVLTATDGVLIFTDKNAAAYLKLNNAGTADVTITGAAAEDKNLVDKVELHKTVTDEKGVSTMQAVDKLVIPAGGSFEFKSGADHIMLMGLKKPLKVGDKVNLVLQFEGGKTQTVELDAKNTPEVK
jgi:copper(I)-binding protein